jgi:hypothetical protein
MSGTIRAGSDLGNSAVPASVGRLGVDGFWVGDYGGGGPCRPPFWRTLEESCKGLGSVVKTNNQHTHPPKSKVHTWRGSLGRREREREREREKERESFIRNYGPSRGV